MLIKDRFKSVELLILELLNPRMVLSQKDKNNLLSLEKGYIGEKKFDCLTKGLPNDWQIINDLLLEYNNTFFQIDTILMNQSTINLIDVKNFEGDYYIEDDIWYTATKIEIKNPLEQLKRSETLFRRFLQSHGYNFHIESNLVFINPEFYLYHAPMNPQIIFPTQLNRFMNKLINTPVKINDRLLKIAEKIASHHIKKSPFMRIPQYEFGRLDKRIFCSKCFAPITNFQMKTIVCNNCDWKENIHLVVLRGVEEIKLLFPNWKITTKEIFEWYGGSIPMRTIRNILSEKFKIEGHGKFSYYLQDPEIQMEFFEM